MYKDSEEAAATGMVNTDAYDSEGWQKHCSVAPPTAPWVGPGADREVHGLGRASGGGAPARCTGGRGPTTGCTEREDARQGRPPFDHH
jgi:hypothetical protein